MESVEVNGNGPVFKINYDHKLVYFNASAIPYLLYWKCIARNGLPEQLEKEHPEIFNRKSPSDYYEVDLKFHRQPVHFTVIPFPEAGWIGFYGEHSKQ